MVEFRFPPPRAVKAKRDAPHRDCSCGNCQKPARSPCVSNRTPSNGHPTPKTVLRAPTCESKKLSPGRLSSDGLSSPDILVSFLPWTSGEERPKFTLRAVAAENSLDFTSGPDLPKSARCTLYESTPPEDVGPPRPAVDTLIGVSNVRWCGDNPDDPKPQDCGDDDGDDEPPSTPAPQPWTPAHPTENCSPEYRVRSIRFSNGCSQDQAEWLTVFHLMAYQVVKGAHRTLNWIAGLDATSRAFYWNWGNNPNFQNMWHGQSGAIFSSLAYWFGGYTEKRLKRVRRVYRRMTDVYENGVPYIFGRRDMKYKCNDVFCPDAGGVLARHWNKYFVQICPNFFAIPNISIDTWFRHRTYAILHEWFHNVDTAYLPQDRCNPVCFGGWNCFNSQCYQDAHRHDANRLIRTWNFRDDADHWGNFPRRLVEAGGTRDAVRNVDSYTSWAMARWVDGQWGRCDGPRLWAHPFPVNYPRIP